MSWDHSLTHSCDQSITRGGHDDSLAQTQKGAELTFCSDSFSGPHFTECKMRGGVVRGGEHSSQDRHGHADTAGSVASADRISLGVKCTLDFVDRSEN